MDPIGTAETKSHPSHRIHVWYVMYEWLIFMVNVSKYASLMGGINMMKDFLHHNSHLENMLFCYQEAMKSTDTLYWHNYVSEKKKKTAYPIRFPGKSASVNGWQKKSRVSLLQHGNQSFFQYVLEHDLYIYKHEDVKQTKLSHLRP